LKYYFGSKSIVGVESLKKLSTSAFLMQNNKISKNTEKYVIKGAVNKTNA
jgi:hypothetical protein